MTDMTVLDLAVLRNEKLKHPEILNKMDGPGETAKELTIIEKLMWWMSLSNQLLYQLICQEENHTI